MNFKKAVEKDLDTFINLNEFAYDHTIDGKVIKCILDEDLFNERSKNKEDIRSGGVYEDTITIFVKMSDIEKPVVDAFMTIDDQDYRVVNVIETEKLFEIELKANEY